ncbi:MAG: endonuclease MutS2 [Ignavibacteria bacterium]|nr:MAG: endonuclease MutS2 [Ignavibacteria bacterium]
MNSFISNSVLEQLEFDKVLNYIAHYCMTEGGKELVLASKPFGSEKDAMEKGSLITEAKEILIERDIPPISYLPELSEIIYKSRIENSLLSQEEIREVLNLAKVSRRTFSFFKSLEWESKIRAKFSPDLFVDKNFENHLSGVFTPSGEIKDSASKELRTIRREIKDKQDVLRSVVARLLKKLSESMLVQEEYTTQRDGRIVLPVKAEHKRHVRGFVHSESATGQTVYIEPEETLELNNDILSLKFAEKREIERILKRLTAKIREVSTDLLKAYNALISIDEIFANAKYSTEIVGSMPSFNGNEAIRLMNARHPVLLKKLGRDKTIPMSIEIKDQRVIIITGPNAGGKTVVLKNFGLQNILASAGIHICADPDSNLHFFNKVLIDIGDKQSIEDDLSTFSSHLSNIKTIIDEADENTLVLLDELGTGTDPSEGAALASAVLKKLSEKKSVVLASTHHGNLKVLANEVEDFQNASMEFDTVELKPTYRFRQGLPGSSYAFEVAERIGLDKNLIESAKQFIDSDKRKIEEFLVDIERKSYAVNKRQRELEIENSRLKGLSQLYEKKIKELEKQKKEILKDTKVKAENYLKGINREFEQTIKKIRESNADKTVIKEEKKKLEKIKKLEEIKYDEEPELIPGDIAVGDYVIIKNSSTGGEVVEIDKEKGKAFILSGSLKIQVKLKDISKSKKPKEIKKSLYDSNKLISNLGSTRLDIRGKKPEEAEFEVIKFLDEAYASNIERVEILHGKGTGVLKQMVHEILRKDDQVKDFYFAKIEMGGEGITIVELK